MAVEYFNNEEFFHEYYTEAEISYAVSKAHPKSAIQIRNREMVDRADLILAVSSERRAALSRRYNMP